MTASALRAATMLPAVVRNLLGRVMDLSWLWVLPGPLQHHAGTPLNTSPERGKSSLPMPTDWGKAAIKSAHRSRGRGLFCRRMDQTALLPYLSRLGFVWLSARRRHDPQKFLLKATYALNLHGSVVPGDSQRVLALKTAKHLTV